MTIIDPWGNEFHSKKEAETFWTKQFWEEMDVDFFSDNFHLDWKVADWIINNPTRWEDYKNDFKDIFDMNLKDYISYCYDESDIDDYD